MTLSSSSTTPASAYLPWQNISVTPSPKCSRSSVIFPPKRRQGFSIRSSEDTAAAAAAVPTAEGGEGESSIEVPEGRPSLISALNVEKALRGIPITDVDHYARLGIPIKCPYDQVAVAYNKKVEEVKSKGLDEEELNERLELLKESYEILSTPEERRLYDWSLARSEKPDRYAWPFEVDTAQKYPGTPPQEEEDEGPTRLVGYFLLGWLILSIALSIGLNR